MADKPLFPPSPSASTTPRPQTDTTILLTPYSRQHDHPRPAAASPYYSDCFNDARVSSQQSLHPVVVSSDDDGNNKRTLLLVYIHGFLGDETSFKSFPAHVHNLVSMSLADTHVIYSKIYPRYQSRKKIEFARDDFSRWLLPHESPVTDVVLLGHSLGGILAAEVILKLAVPGDHSPRVQQFQHKILGLVAFDSPFLGIHPSVVGTGLASLFRGTPPPSDETSSSVATAAGTAVTDTNSTSADASTSELWSAPTDQTFNPAYTNDVHLARRTGKLNRAFYFLSKHWGSVNMAMCNYIDSHFEHGGIMADYPGLRRRYNAIRALEDVNPFSSTRPSRRVRFANYYSATAPPQKEKDRKFCMLPWSSSSTKTDRTWIRVAMPGMDQVTAHTSMFNMSEAYAQLVGDTAARIEAQ
ncbi:hypothetical protein DV736_g4222, partial [Chaetothyriales sp. CBS 134916]